jgi:pimeloyl-ACP methyl ester carboxylesterase
MRTRVFTLSVALIMTMTACGSGNSDGPTSKSPKTKNIARTFDIGGGRKLFLQCEGTGSPTILLEAGDESGVDEWGAVEPGLAKKTRTCAYDRAGNGQSDEATGCRRLDDLLGDLEALLRVAKVKAPFVLVGASGGGFLMTAFAARHPGDVAGLVLAEVPKAITIMPPGLKEDIACDAPNNIERRDYYAVEHESWDGRKRIGDFPMTIISNQYPKGLPRGDENTNVKDQRGWLVLSSRSKQVVVTTGHDVTENEAPLVTKEILAVLKASRTG